MKTASDYRFHRRALSAFYELAEDEQAQIIQVLAAWPTPAAGHATKLPGDQPLFMQRINDSLRLIVRSVPGEAPEVMDLVRRETLESFAQAECKNGQ